MITPIKLIYVISQQAGNEKTRKHLVFHDTCNLWSSFGHEWWQFHTANLSLNGKKVKQERNLSSGKLVSCNVNTFQWHYGKRQLPQKTRSCELCDVKSKIWHGSTINARYYISWKAIVYLIPSSCGEASFVMVRWRRRCALCWQTKNG